MVRGLLWVSAAEGMEWCQRRRAIDARDDDGQRCILCGEIPGQASSPAETGPVEQVQLEPGSKEATYNDPSVSIHHAAPQRHRTVALGRAEEHQRC